MDWFVKAFLKSSVAWLSAGVTLGISMAVWPPLAVYRTAHLHMMLLGFVAMMIFGVAYHVVPRFAGYPLYSPRAAGVHWWMSNVGLALMALGFAGRVNAAQWAPVSLGIGGVCAGSGAYVFAYLIWRTIDGRVAPRKVPTAAVSSARRLPIA